MGLVWNSAGKQSKELAMQFRLEPYGCQNLPASTSGAFDSTHGSVCFITAINSSPLSSAAQIFIRIIKDDDAIKNYKVLNVHGTDEISRLLVAKLWV